MSEPIYRELLLGCGYRRQRLLRPSDAPRTTQEFQNLVTVDNNPKCKPDYLMDLQWHGSQWALAHKPTLHPDLWQHEASLQQWRFRENIFDEVHAYEVLEHLGDQGDVSTFFSHFEEIWRMLKPGGYLCASVPSRYSPWLWGDPGHRRAILPASLMFLRQPQYELIGTDDPSSDYRSVYGGDFDIVLTHDDHKSHNFILKAVKPARVLP